MSLLNFHISRISRKNKINRFRNFVTAIIFGLLIISSSAVFAQDKKAIVLEDMAQWKTISKSSISNDGNWMAYYVKPNEGDGTLYVKSVQAGTEYNFSRGASFEFTPDSKFVIGRTTAPLDVNGVKEKKFKAELFIMKLSDGQVDEIENVESYKVSDDSKYAAYSRSEKNDVKMVVLREIATGIEKEFKDASKYQFDKNSTMLVHVVESKNSDENGVYVAELETINRRTLKNGAGKYTNFVWNTDNSKAAFLYTPENMDSLGLVPTVYSWDVNSDTDAPKVDALQMNGVPEGMKVAPNAGFRWSKDSEKLALNVQPKKEFVPKSDSKVELPDVDVWHWKDVYIQSQQKVMLNRLKNKSYSAVYNFSSGNLFQLETEAVENIRIDPNHNFAIGIDNSEIKAQSPWLNAPAQKVMLTNLETGEMDLILEKIDGRINWSSTGKYLYWFTEGDWHVFSMAEKKVKNITKDVAAEFTNTDVDRPTTLPSWGTAGWTLNDEYIALYDRNDIWLVSPEDGRAVQLTGGNGKKMNATFRYTRLNSSEKSIDLSKDIMLSYVNNDDFSTGYYKLESGENAPEYLFGLEKKIGRLTKAKNADVLMYTIETFIEFPNLYTSNMTFSDVHIQTDVNPQQKDYKWGTNQLVEWVSIDGTPLRGVLFLPEDYDPSKKYPLMLYIYEMMSSTYHGHFPPIANHRFNATEYTSNGYAVLKPDIVYKKGLPGESSVNSVVPAVQKIIDMGIADPKKVGIHGHSWGAYEVTYIITQTNLFAAGGAGATVSNMTSAYGGIRWGSGNPRTFQYETGQSRIGANLWEKPELYIENSPLFFADRVETPLLLMHGDADDAVPWYQSIEYFLAFRRLNKPVWFLQYNGEPHHLKKLKNQKDFTQKMFDFYEHFLNDKPAPEWMEKGVSILDKGKK